MSEYFDMFGVIMIVLMIISLLNIVISEEIIPKALSAITFFIVFVGMILCLILGEYYATSEVKIASNLTIDELLKKGYVIVEKNGNGTYDAIKYDESLIMEEIEVVEWVRFLNLQN